MAGFWDYAKEWVPGAKDAEKLKQRSPKADKERRRKTRDPHSVSKDRRSKNPNSTSR